jgi:tetratricopeptide (TPR) repeat protein
VRTLLAGLLVGWTLFAADGAAEGHDGNDRYQDGAYAQARRAYGSGLAERDRRAAARITSALWHNLGLALHRTDSTQRAMAAFQSAITTAPGSLAHGRAAYNAGTAAAQAGRDEAALGRLREALLADPSRTDARFNFEVIKRELEREEKRKKKKKKKRKRQSPPDVQPSSFAERLKARADSLVAQRQYADAHQLMERGLRRDSTVRAYRSFIQRTGAVAQIDTLGAGS